MGALDASAFGKVAVLMGGRSGEREISLRSGAAVVDALLKSHVDAHGIDVGKDIFHVLQVEKFDRAFIALHGCGGEDGAMQGGLETIAMPYTGSGVMASSICMNKVMTKQIWSAEGINSPRFMNVDTSTPYEEVAANLGKPFVVKPSLEGSSLGVHKIESEQQYQSALQDALQYQGSLMTEQWITGEEYTVAILNGNALPVIRLETPHDFYDFAAKYQSSNTQYILPCGLSTEDEEALQKQALIAFNATGASGWGRVDVMVDADRTNWFLEVNTVPGMTSQSLVPMAAASIGIDFPELAMKILATSQVG